MSPKSKPSPKGQSIKHTPTPSSPAPKPKQPKQPQLRVLPPDIAKSLSRTSPNSSSSSSYTADAVPNKQKPLLTSPSLFSQFRTRLTTLPRPILRTFRVLSVLAPVVPIGLFFSEHVMQVMWVRGPSMTPYLNEDWDNTHTKSDMVLVNMWPLGPGWPWERERRRRLERGMVVTFRSPANPSHIAIKRVIGLPGDRIMTRQPCLKPTQIVPFNHVWLEGDAEDARKSLDSNTYGPVSVSLITGRVFAVLGPRARWLNWSDWEKESGSADGAKPDNKQVIENQYRQDVRDRVLKEAVKLEQPVLH